MPLHCVRTVQQVFDIGLLLRTLTALLPSGLSHDLHSDRHDNLQSIGSPTDKPGPLGWRSPLWKMFGEELAAPMCLHPQRVNSKLVRVTSLPAHPQRLSHQHAAQDVPQPHFPGPCNDDTTVIPSLYRQFPGNATCDLRQPVLK